MAAKLSTDHLGPNLKRLREAAGATLNDVAAYLEVGRAFIHKLETGASAPSLARFIELVDYFGCKPVDLLKPPPK